MRYEKCEELAKGASSICERNTSVDVHGIVEVFALCLTIMASCPSLPFATLGLAILQQSF